MNGCEILKCKYFDGKKCLIDGPTCIYNLPDQIRQKEDEQQKEIDSLRQENERLKEELKEYLMDFVSMNCTASGTKELDSFAISTNADAMRRLAEMGVLTIEKEYGRRVIGHWNKQALSGGKEKEE